MDGSQKYDIKTVVQNKHKTYHDSFKDVAETIIEQSKMLMDTGYNKEKYILHYIIDLKEVPNFLQQEIAQNIQNQLQKATY